MNRMAEFKHGLEEAWHSVADGWRQLRERAAGALTHFGPEKAASAADARAPESAQFPAATWALLAGDVFEDDDKLVVRGEKRYEHEATAGRYRVRQCAYGSFHRAIPLPSPVEADGAKATYRNGVLRIELPKAARAKTRRIEIRGG
ncbi:Hsp20/alpha crystallin family protein [Azoarcus sp. PA01]|nr:Hsp20/alpha crystallin family protein [Azoarcus sp. PA01]